MLSVVLPALLLLVCPGLAGCSPAVAAPATPSAPVTVIAQGSPDSPAPGRPEPFAVPSVPDASSSPTAPDEEGPLPEVALTPNLLYQLLAAEIAAQRGEAGAAYGTLIRVARELRDPRIARRATEVAMAARASDQALQAAQLWREIAPKSETAAQMVESLSLATGRFVEIEPALAQRLRSAREDATIAQVYAELQRQLLRSQNRTGAWLLLERISSPDLEVAAARRARAALAAAAEQPEKAVAEAREALRLDPGDETTIVSLAQYLLQLGPDASAALELLHGYLQMQPAAADARLALARVLLSESRLDEARRQFERLQEQYPDNPQVLFSLAQIAYQNQALPEAEQLLLRYLELPRSPGLDVSIAYLFLAQIAEEGQRLNEALDWLARVPRGAQYLAATVRRALLLGRTGKVAEGRELLRGAPAVSSRERVQLISGEAQLLREARLNLEAFELLRVALERLPDNTELLYDFAMAAERLDRLEDMERSLRRLIELRPEHAHAYNALGYTLADRNLRLDEARSLIEKALELAPDDGHILDSMGWVLFRLKDYEGALKYLRQAYRLAPEAEIATHLGEVLWALGRIEEAKQVWREARGREPDNISLRDTLARLKVEL